MYNLRAAKQTVCHPNVEIAFGQEGIVLSIYKLEEVCVVFFETFGSDSFGSPHVN